MTDGPDFDNMSPEEMMRWMESLAKRSGATEGFTTDADMEVEEVSEDDERLAEAGEYIPYGWTEERWREQQAKEAAEKAKRQQQAPQPPAQQPAAQQPEPEPQQPAAAAEAGGAAELDFDNMSPEEMMRWMESLAKRSGATEGFTTDADMEVGEVSADDERLKDAPQYIPYGWTEERWREQQAKEAAEKAKRQQQQPPVAQQPQQPAAQASQDEPQEIDLEAIFGSDDYLPPYEDLDQEAAFGIRSDDDTADADPLDFLSAISGEDDAASGFDFSALEDLGGDDDEAGFDFAALEGLGGDDDAASFDFGALAGFGEGDDDDADESEPADWLASLTGGADNIADVQPQEGSLAWMESLARNQGADEEELVTDPGFEVPPVDPREDTGPGYRPFSFEEGTGLGQDFDDEFEYEEDDDEAFVLEGADFDGDPESWLDSLASGVGEGDAGAGETYGEDDEEEDEFAFLNQASSNVIGDAEDAEDAEEFDSLAANIRQSLATGEIDPNDVDQFFKKAFEKAATRDVPDYIDEDEAFDEDDMPVQAEIPDWLKEQMSDLPMDEIDDDLPAKTATAEMMIGDLFGDDDDGDPVDEFTLDNEAEDEGLPAWLSEGADDDTGQIADDIFSMGDTDQMPAWLEEVDVEDDEEESVGANIERDDIFAGFQMDDEDEEDAEALTEADLSSLFGEVEAEAEYEEDDEEDEELSKMDTSDTWVQAFIGEESDEMADWYNQRINELSDTGKIKAMRAAEEAAEQQSASEAQPAAEVQLQAAELPIETNLPAGQPMGLPDWMQAEGAADVASTRTQGEFAGVAEIEDDDMDWLDLSDADETVEEAFPDWLREQVDESVTAGEALPEWLDSEEELADIDPQEIPDWLRETMEEDQPSSVAFDLEEPITPSVQTPVPAPQAPVQPVVAQESPAPVSPAARKINPDELLTTAQERIQAGDVDGSMAAYEQIIRANLALDRVESALRKLSDERDYKRNPAVYRTLGDVLMRQGKLQEALDTYRRALNML